MKLLVWTLYGLAVWAILAGLWDHSWRLILAGVAVAVIWPAIENDVRFRQQRTLLDELWDDDDLSDSA